MKSAQMSPANWLLALVAVNVTGVLAWLGWANRDWFSRPVATKVKPEPVWFSPQNFSGFETAVESEKQSSLTVEIRRVTDVTMRRSTGLLQLKGADNPPSATDVAAKGFDACDLALSRMMTAKWKAPASASAAKYTAALRIIIPPDGGKTVCIVERKTGDAPFDAALVQFAGEIGTVTPPLPDEWRGGAYEIIAELGFR